MRLSHLTVVAVVLTAVSLGAGLALDLEMAHAELPGLELLDSALTASLCQLPADGALDPSLGGLLERLPVTLEQ